MYLGIRAMLCAFGVLWWSSRYIQRISMQSFSRKVIFKIKKGLPEYQPDKLTGSQKSPDIHALRLWTMSCQSCHTFLGQSDIKSTESDAFLWAMPEDLANTPAERAAATEQVYRPIHFFYSKELRELRPKSWRICHGSMTDINISMYYA